MKKAIFLSSLVFFCCSMGLWAQKNGSREKNENIKTQQAEVARTDEPVASYKRTTHPDAQWYPQAGFGMFIHWGISSVKELELSWPMMAGTQIGWRPANDRLSADSVKKIMESGDYFTGHDCKKDNSCITPNEYWAMAKDFNPKDCDPEKWVKAAKEAGMTYAVFTAKHHDGFAMWPSAYGNFNTKNYLGGRDFVKEFVTACRKYGLKTGLYFSPPDWYFDGEYRNFMYYGVGRDYPHIPVLDRDLHPGTAVKTAEEKQAHYREVAAFVKGQVEELLTNYGKIDMIWFDKDGVPVIPAGNAAWKECITMERVHQLQPGIIVSPRLFGYGDYHSFESDKNFPVMKQDGWAEFCTTAATSGWGHTKAPLKSTAHLLNYLVRSRSFNTNMLLNYGPTKDGAFTADMYQSLAEISGWMKVNGVSVKGARALDAPEWASVPATKRKKHRYLFLLAPVNGERAAEEKVEFYTGGAVKRVSLLGHSQKPGYKIEANKLIVDVPVGMRRTLPLVIDVELE
ncbi:alpha-L-fucosidase [Niabella aurantiaca]|uniref:alpha-L-fucosidase n=1 Tax=Niabella aurantiaca TaxID=379900 RepID=UPI000362B474|nr:alpha-L-fucosidase [Niabella aurantiaca]